MTSFQSKDSLLLSHSGKEAARHFKIDSNGQTSLSYNVLGCAAVIRKYIYPGMQKAAFSSRAVVCFVLDACWCWFWCKCWCPAVLVLVLVTVLHLKVLSRITHS